MEPIRFDLVPVPELCRLWGADEPPHFPDDGSQPSGEQYFPPLGGWRNPFDEPCLLVVCLVGAHHDNV